MNMGMGRIMNMGMGRIMNMGMGRIMSMGMRIVTTVRADFKWLSILCQVPDKVLRITDYVLI
jgi:hypothetical protein